MAGKKNAAWWRAYRARKAGLPVPVPEPVATVAPAPVAAPPAASPPDVPDFDLFADFDAPPADPTHPARDSRPGLTAAPGAPAAPAAPGATQPAPRALSTQLAQFAQANQAQGKPAPAQAQGQQPAQAAPAQAEAGQAESGQAQQGQQRAQASTARAQTTRAQAQGEPAQAAQGQAQGAREQAQGAREAKAERGKRVEEEEKATVRGCRGGEGREGAAVVLSPATPTRATRHNPIVARPRVPLCAPSGPAAYLKAKGMLAEGRTWTEIEAETGMFRQPYVEAAYVLDDFEGFTEAERAQKACIGARIAGRAMDCAFAGVKTRTRTKTDIDGKVERETVEERYADPAFARIAGEYSDPATHGRAAGRGPAIQVTANNAAIFGGSPTPDSLQAFDPRGLQ